MICTCGCRHSYCEKTLTGHSERCMDCGKMEYYIIPETEFGKGIVEEFALFPKTPSLLSERHSRNGIGVEVGEY